MTEEDPSTAPTPLQHHENKDKVGLSDSGFVAKTLEKLLPKLMGSLGKVEVVIDQLIVLYNKVHELYLQGHKKLEQYNPEAVIGMLNGFLLIFFGGFFIVTLAMIEAFNQGGAETMFENFGILRQQVHHVRLANEEDDKKDDDGDGVADVKQITKEQLASRKLQLIFSSMDPFVMQAAFANMWTATLSAASTVKLVFARTIALGVSIGNNLYRPIERYVIPLLVRNTPPTYHKWYPMVFSYICRMIGASLAFQIQRILSTVSSAMKGGHMLIDNFALLCETRGLTYLSEGYLDDILAWALVVVGIYSQIFLFTSLPFVIKLMFFPAFLTEWLLTTLVSSV
ncbi:hypothetical protein BASA81_002306 [Batrachochytrium salamandrivorans]|nr:hypothetical protein BASA81_002306 [Batrachochytrium salamandrivorans]